MKGGGGALLATITSFHKTVYPHNSERHLKSLIPIGMKVLVLSKQVDCPEAAGLPVILGGRRGACGGHRECAEMGQLQPECFSSASKPWLLSPPHPSPSLPLFNLVLKGSKMVTRFRAEASKMLHNREDKGVLRGQSLIQRPWQCSPDPALRGLNPLPRAGFSGRAGGGAEEPVPASGSPEGAWGGRSPPGRLSSPGGSTQEVGWKQQGKEGEFCPFPRGEQGRSSGWGGPRGGWSWDVGSQLRKQTP